MLRNHGKYGICESDPDNNFAAKTHQTNENSWMHQNPNSRHRRKESCAVLANLILGGLHHEYFLAPACA